MILNQTRSGKTCPQAIAALNRSVPEDSLMCYVIVHALELATALDRLECLEDFQAQALKLSRQLSNHKSVD